MYYIGVRSCQGSSSDDLGKNYFSSSLNKQFISEQKVYPNNFKYEVIHEYITRKEANEAEYRLHKELDVAHDDTSYNRANGNYNWS